MQDSPLEKRGMVVPNMKFKETKPATVVVLQDSPLEKRGVPGFQANFK
jgi:hypothetical protein